MTALELLRLAQETVDVINARRWAVDPAKGAGDAAGLEILDAMGRLEEGLMQHLYPPPTPEDRVIKEVQEMVRLRECGLDQLVYRVRMRAERLAGMVAIKAPSALLEGMFVPLFQQAVDDLLRRVPTRGTEGTKE